MAAVSPSLVTGASARSGTVSGDDVGWVGRVSLSPVPGTAVESVSGGLGSDPDGGADGFGAGTQLTSIIKAIRNKAK
ncbi:hypothetical protein ACFLUZ_05610 [Chloroflexota bacterium]